MPVRVICVLRSGGEYLPEHVADLRDQVAMHAPKSRFVCISDVDVPCERIEMLHMWPGWFSKIEMFRLPGPCLYLDLDSVIVDSLEPLLEIARTRPFTVAHPDFGQQKSGREVASGLMAWSAGNTTLGLLYTRFRCHPRHHMDDNNCREFWGDQGFIERYADGWEHWQDHLPGAVVSYKLQCSDGVPKGARVLYFHGFPRPWEVIDKIWLH